MNAPGRAIRADPTPQLTVKIEFTLTKRCLCGKLNADPLTARHRREVVLFHVSTATFGRSLEPPSMSRSPHVLSILLGIAMVAATSGSALAAKSKSAAPVDPHPITALSPPVIIGAPTATLDPDCSAGNLLEPVDNYDDIIPEGGPDVFITRIDPSTCSCGPDGQLRVNQVQLTLFSQYTSCQMPVDLYFYGVKGAAGCAQAPDEAHVLAHFGPINMPLTQALTPTTATPYIFNLATPVDLPHVAFVGVAFTSWGNCQVQYPPPPLPGDVYNPELVYGDTTQCLPCTSFNYYQDAGGWTRTEYCHRTHFPFLLSANGTCGNYVSALPATWGQLKIRYGSPRRRRRRVTVRRPRSTGRTRAPRPEVWRLPTSA